MYIATTECEQLYIATIALRYLDSIELYDSMHGHVCVDSYCQSHMFKAHFNGQQHEAKKLTSIVNHTCSKPISMDISMKQES